MQSEEGGPLSKKGKKEMKVLRFRKINPKMQHKRNCRTWYFEALLHLCYGSNGIVFLNNLTFYPEKTRKNP